ncbi:MAG: FprA family A-type flavoprotein [Treponema sp.]|jgi:flavorubredoxin|nr:FprA family A-type flavoprotein [Treponema sp.]
MKARLISDSLYCLHADIHTSDLFEGIWPIPQGVSLNSYVVKGEKTALIDLFRDWTEAPAQIGSELDSIGMDFSSFDYLILNHLEPDHTGWLREFHEKNPGAGIISTAKGINLVKTFYKIETGLRAVKDGDTLDLGGGRVLSFHETPNVHWPETMMTWDAQSGSLFSCDAFGSFGSLGGRVFDDEFSNIELRGFESETLRYYSNIVSSFSIFVERAVQKFEGFTINCVAPSHGIIWRKEPKKIIALYLKYAAWAKGPAEKSIAVIWGSMYGNTKAGLDAVLRGIEQEGVAYSIHRVPNEDVSWILADAWKSSGLVFAMPTYEYAMFPPMAYVLDIFRRKHVFGKKVLRIGSWGWVGGAKKEYDAAIEALRCENMESIEWAGCPSPEEFAKLEEAGRALAKVVKT